jgi:uncharacterized glyoxalase superfamily protein PhnB
LNISPQNATLAAVSRRANAGRRSRMRMNTPGGEVAHAELEIGGRIVMLADRLPVYPVADNF